MVLFLLNVKYCKTKRNQYYYITQCVLLINILHSSVFLGENTQYK